MGLGAWLAAITDRKEFEVQEKRESRAIRAKPAAGEEEIYEVFDDYNIPRTSLMPLADHLIQNFELWVKVCRSAIFFTHHQIMPLFLCIQNTYSLDSAKGMLTSFYSS
jgi:hypothetical protein